MKRLFGAEILITNSYIIRAGMSSPEALRDGVALS